MKKNLRKVFAVSMAGAMVAGCIPAMADEAASTTNWEPFAETVTLRVPVYDQRCRRCSGCFQQLLDRLDSGEFWRSVEH